MRERLGGDDAYDDGDDETRKSQKVGGAPSLSGSRNCHGREPVSAPGSVNVLCSCSPSTRANPGCSQHKPPCRKLSRPRVEEGCVIGRKVHASYVTRKTVAGRQFGPPKREAAPRTRNRAAVATKVWLPFFFFFFLCDFR